MARYRVTRPDPLEAETIEADSCQIEVSGALVFTRNLVTSTSAGRVLVQAYASGRWVEVSRVQGVSKDALEDHSGEPFHG